MSDRRFAPSTIPPTAAFGVWLAGWFLGGAVLGVVVLRLMGHETGAPTTTPQLAAAAVVGWATLLAGLWWLSRHRGTGDPIVDYAIAFRPIDLLGIPAGILAQAVIVPGVYLPLRGVWPDTFSNEQLEERAQELADQAEGAMTVLLVFVVVVGAPIVEELVYRGLLQRSVASVAGRWAALVFVSLLFSLVHLSPVEYPGLFVAGLVFGGALLLTGRTGAAIITHAAFNATGIWLLLT